MPRSTVVVQRWQNCECGGVKGKKEFFRSIHSSKAGLKRFIKSAHESWQETLDAEMGHSCSSTPIGKLRILNAPNDVIARVRLGKDGFFLKDGQVINRLK